ncbi:DUF748 domain-containing protein [Halopseudomonas pelagia]|uniref:DUF748 domain-containing protein n=1 Tax=Halopseudomonas pelagia TaxID=553151 RepID=A0AA91Z7Q7_9GAMM|nr:DUF748 domain-containing protein [Halopseudomonas pelagia]PCD01329.1 hypothetical protein CO192_00390 [Halopseudomonas pelagia]QFY55779.1 DUF748 domain-containing protein [Halopseudomonas pelagia]
MPKRAKIIAVSLLIGLFVYALLGFLLLPGVALHLINKQLEQRVTEPAHLERLEFNPFSLELEAGQLTIGPEEQPDIAWRRLYANLEWKSLWTGALHLAEVQLDRANVRILFDEQGNLNLAQLLAKAENQTQEEPTEPSDPFPIRIERLTLTQNSLYFEDRQPGDQVTFAYNAIDLELLNLTTVSQEDANMTLAASGPDGAQLDWQSTFSINPLSSTGQLSVTDTQLQTFWPYVREQLPLVLSQGSMGFSSDYHLDMSDSLELTLENTRIDLRQLALQDTKEQPLLQLESLEVSDTRVDLAARQVRIGNVTGSALEAWIERNDEGELNWLALFDTSNEPEDPASEPWRVLLNQAQFSDNKLHLTDRQPEEDVTLLLSPLELEIAEFDSQGNTPFSLILDTGVGERGQLRAEGQGQISPLSADLKVTTQSLDLRLAQAYLAPLVRMELRSGRLDSSLDVAVDAREKLDLSINGTAKIDQLHILDTVRNRDLLKWEALQLDGIAYQDNALAIESAALVQPYGRFIINQDLTTNINELIITQPTSESTEEQDSGQTQNEPMAIRIGSVVIEDGSANFADFSLRPPFGTAIAQLNGNIGTLDNQSTEPAEIDITGNVDRYAPVTIQGSLTPFDPLNSLDITTRFRNVELTTLTPYSSKFAGYRIRKGRLNLDLHYRIEQGQLSAENKVLLEDLQLGERVDSPDAVDLPVRLAVALLKDSRGNIDIELPVSGDLNNPEFSIMPIIWQTLGNLMQRAVQAPFKMLASLVSGSSDADLSQIGFQPGSAELDEQAKQALDTLATALRDRPGLLLEVEGMSAPAKDGPLIGEQRLEREFQQRKLRQLQERGEEVPEDASQLNVAEEDKREMLENIYQTRLKQDIPAAWQALPAEERERNLRQAITSQWGQNTAILRRLAQQRNDAIKAYLVDNANLEASRVYLLDVGTQAEAEGEQVFTKLELGSE